MNDKGGQGKALLSHMPQGWQIGGKYETDQDENKEREIIEG